MLYEATCNNCKGQWISGEDDATYCDPCVIAGINEDSRLQGTIRRSINAHFTDAHNNARN